MKISRDIKVFLMGTVFTTITIGGLVVTPLNKSIEELNLKNEHSIQVNNDLMNKNTKLIKKNSKKSKELIKKDEEIKQLQEKLKEFEFKSVKFNPNDVTQLTSIKEKQLKILFKSNSTYENLIGLEQAFVDAENKYGVNAIFLLGIVGQESGFGKSRRAIEDNNLTGYAIYNNNSGKQFDSKSEGITKTAKLLKENYIDKSLKDIYSIGSVYCPNDEWAEPILEIMNIIVYDMNSLI